MNNALVVAKDPADPTQTLSFYLNLDSQPLPRIGESLSLQGIGFRVTDVLHEISPDADDHGLTLSVEFLPNHRAKSLADAHEQIEGFYSGGEEEDLALTEIEFETAD